MRHAESVDGKRHWAKDDETAVSLEFVAVRVEGCACGGLLRANPENSRDVWLAVVRHRRTYRHQGWLARVEAGE